MGRERLAGPPLAPLPRLVVHADWSVSARKRWCVRAMLTANGRYRLQAPEAVRDVPAWLAGLRAAAADGAVLVGFDFPIGLPRAYAAQAGVRDFLALLPRLGAGAWADFYRVAETAAEIGLRRPFYPQRPGGTRRQQLLAALGVDDIDALRRACDLPQPGRRAAAPLFWTLGAQQVGKAAIAGWRDLLAPALAGPNAAAVWPFSGRLDALLRRGGLLFAEAYPAEFYGHLALQPGARGGSKRRQASRQQAGARLLAWAAAAGVTLDPALETAVAGGFGVAAAGEDPFDATVGVMGMLNLLLGGRRVDEPADDVVRQVEGWILGQGMASTAGERPAAPD